ncbi:MAG: ABC transporter permease [Planctomycetota bacterium]
MSGEADAILPSTGRLSGRSAWTTLALFAARQAAWSRRAILAYVLFALPLVVAAVIVNAAPIKGADQAAEIYWALTLLMMLTASLPLAAMLSCGPLILNEVSDGTLVYLLTRRLPRQQVLLAKFAGATLSVLGLAVAFQAALFLIFAVGGPGLGAAETVPALTGGLFVVAVSALVFAAVFTAIGVLFRKPLGVGIGYLIVTEWVFLRLPVGIRRFTVGYHLRCLLAGVCEAPTLDELLGEVLGRPLESPVAAAWILLAVVVGGLTAAAVLVARREFTRAREEER